MCGIAAVFAYKGALRDGVIDGLVHASARIACRGPDGDGLWVGPDRDVALAHRRLAVIDLSEAGEQPMHDADAGLSITFNGEIYNFADLRAELQSQGDRFKSVSDTEVLLKLYARYGANMVQRLRGMFAFAIWDGGRKELFLARDPFGIKPLYYADDGTCICVASETKSLVRIDGVDARPSAAGQVAFLLWGHVPEPFTSYSGIRALPAGCTMTVTERGAGDVVAFASVADLFRSAESAASFHDTAIDTRATLREALLDSIRAHLVSDREVGVFLSAGLDSTTVAALAVEAGGRLRTVTLGFEEFRGTPLDETPLAELVARRLGTDHTTVWVTQEDFASERQRILDRMDQPSVDGANTYFVARAAASAGLRVVLSGLGGDELFGGYPSFRDVPRLVTLVSHAHLPRRAGRFARSVADPFVRRITSPKYAGILEYGGDWGGAYMLRRGLFMPWELSRLLDETTVRQGLWELRTMEELNRTVRGLRSARFKVSALEAAWYMRSQLLRDADWAGMSHSVEIRTPLVDWPLWTTATRLIARDSTISKHAMARTVALPAEVLARAKTGFGIPIRSWLVDGSTTSHRGLRGWARQVFAASHESPADRSSHRSTMVGA